MVEVSNKTAVYRNIQTISHNLFLMAEVSLTTPTLAGPVTLRREIVTKSVIVWRTQTSRWDTDDAMCIYIICEQKWKGLLKYAHETSQLLTCFVSVCSRASLPSTLTPNVGEWVSSLLIFPAFPYRRSPFPSEPRWSRRSRRGDARGARGRRHLPLRGHQHPPAHTDVSIRLHQITFLTWYPWVISPTRTFRMKHWQPDAVCAYLNKWVLACWHSIYGKALSHVAFTQHC